MGQDVTELRLFVPLMKRQREANPNSVREVEALRLHQKRVDVHITDQSGDDLALVLDGLVDATALAQPLLKKEPKRTGS